MAKIFAHRGYKGKYPENTMVAFKKAIEYGADGIELDVHLTADGEIVVIHDDTIDRTTNSKGFVAELKWDELKKVKMKGKFKKERIPLLKEVLDLIQPTELELNIEIKAHTEGVLEEKLIKLLTQYEMDDRIIFSSFHLSSMQYIKSLAPRYETAYLYSGYLDQPWLLRGEAYFDALHVNSFYLSRNYTATIQSHDLKARVYTVNRPIDLKYWLESEIDSVITDQLELALEIKNSLDRH